MLASLPDSPYFPPSLSPSCPFCTLYFSILFSLSIKTDTQAWMMFCFRREASISLCTNKTHVPLRPANAPGKMPGMFNGNVSHARNHLPTRHGELALCETLLHFENSKGFVSFWLLFGSSASSQLFHCRLICLKVFSTSSSLCFLMVSFNAVLKPSEYCAGIHDLVHLHKAARESLDVFLCDGWLRSAQHFSIVLPETRWF